MISEDRLNRFREVISKRQPDLTVVLEDVKDPHNISAVLRSCDAVGIREIYVIDTYEAYGRIKSKKDHLGKKSSASAKKWIDIHRFDKAEDCMIAVREKYDRIYATHLSQDAKDLYDLDLCASTALVFGNEHGGISEEVLAACDGNFIIPMVGMIPSLNISVACAVSLYEAYRQRAAQGYYIGSQLPETEAKSIYQNWVDRDMARKKNPGPSPEY
jgi:tRNA (guanosine-2'-O-)-methyltransferase